MTDYKKNSIQKEKAHAFTTASILKSFEEVEKNMDEAVRSSTYKEKLSREYAMKFIANI